MALVNIRDMLNHAYENNYAVGAFDLVSMDFLEAVIGAAESCRSAIILSISETHFDHYDVELMLPTIEAAAKRAAVPIAIQLDNSSCLESAMKAINMGCNGIMMDTSHLNFTNGIEKIQSIVEIAHECGISVIGDMKYISGEISEGSESNLLTTPLTIPCEAKVYTERTGVDFLIVSIGSKQGSGTGRMKLDFKRLKKINQSVGIPLVVRGGSLFSEDQIHKLVLNGVAKINYNAVISDVASKTIRICNKSFPRADFIDIKKEVNEAVGDEVQRRLRQSGSAGRAAEVLERCEPCRPVDHFIVHNFRAHNNHSQDRVMVEGKRFLAQVPGVRKVSTGEVLEKNSQYCFSWSVRFIHQSALDRFRKNKDFDGFLEKQFHTNMKDIISFDYQANA